MENNQNPSQPNNQLPNQPTAPAMVPSNLPSANALGKPTQNPIPTPTTPTSQPVSQPIAANANPNQTVSPAQPTNPATAQTTEPKKSFISSPKLTKLFIVLAIFIVLLGLFFLFFRLPISIATNANSQLTFDNKSRGTSTNFKIWARPGAHTIRLESLGFTPANQTVNQTWFKLQNLNLVLKKAPDLSLIDTGANALIVQQNNVSSLLYFNAERSAFYRYNFDTKEKSAITPAIFKNLLQLKWNQSGNGVIVWLKYDPVVFKGTLFEKNTLKKNDVATFYYDFHHYDITAQSTTLWGTDIFEIAWSNSPDRFYFIGGSGTNGYLGKAENNGATKSRLLTNMPFTQADLAIDSQENNAYILANHFIYQVNLIDPARTLNQLTNGNNTHLILVDDTHLLLGASQADPRYKSQEKYTLYNLTSKQFEGADFYANRGWIYNLNNTWTILQAINNLASNQSSWLIQNLTLPDSQVAFNYEYLTKQVPTQINYDPGRKILIVEVDKKLYSLPIIN